MTASPGPIVSPAPAGAPADLARATLRETAASRRVARGLAAWHLLSLDAPTVAALWLYFLARCAGVNVPWTSPAAMFVAVWMLYAADRLLDTHRVLGTSSWRGTQELLEERHYFHHRNVRAFTTALVCAAALLLALLNGTYPLTLRLYCVLGVLLAAWLLAVHLRSHRRATALPKEVMVGLFFSAAVFIPTVARAPALWLKILPLSLIFAALCSLNCLYIFAWEHAGEDRHAHPTTQWAIQRLPALTAVLTCSSLILAALLRNVSTTHSAHGSAFAALACALSAVCLQLLHRVHWKLRPVTVRAAADLCLLTPVLLLPCMAFFAHAV